jgi:hypothetical protein
MNRNMINVPNATLTSGSGYWIALLGTSGTLQFRDVSNGGASESSFQGNLTALPATWSTSSTFKDGVRIVGRDKHAGVVGSADHSVMERD